LVAVAHLSSVGYSAQQLTGDLVDYLRQGFLALVAPDLVAVSGTERQALAERAERVGLAALVRAMEVLGQAQVSMRDAPDPRVNLEVALVRLAHPEADDSPEAILVRIERLEAAGRLAAAGQPSPNVHRPEPEAGGASAPTTTGGGPSEPVGASPRQTLGAVRRRAGPAPIERAPATPGPASAHEPNAPTAGDRQDAGGSGSSPMAAPGPFPTRDELVQAWGDHIIGRLRPKAKALFQAGRFVSAEGDQAVFVLPNEIHRTRCEEVRGEIEAALSDYFGRPVGLALLVDAGAGPGGESAPGQGDDPPSAAPRSSTASNSTPPKERSPEPGPAGSVPAESRTDRRNRSAPGPAPATRPETDSGGEEPDDSEDLSVFDESQLGEVADVDNSAQARVLEAFPGAEEVN
jgi:DNA polymerase III gamma/tau subunit